MDYRYLSAVTGAFNRCAAEPPRREKFSGWLSGKAARKLARCVRLAAEHGDIHGVRVVVAGSMYNAQDIVTAPVFRAEGGWLGDPDPETGAYPVPTHVVRALSRFYRRPWDSLRLKLVHCTDGVEHGRRVMNAVVIVSSFV